MVTSTKTVRARLTVMVRGRAGHRLDIFSAGVYILFREYSQNRLDSQLRSAVQVTELALNHESRNTEVRRQKGKERTATFCIRCVGPLFPNIAISVSVRENIGGRREPGCAARHRRTGHIRPGAPELDTLRLDDRRYRVLSREVFVPFTQHTIAFERTSRLEQRENEARQSARALLFSVPLLIVLSAAGGYFLARKSLQPVSDMAQTMQRISSINLGARLRIENPSDEFGILGESLDRLLDRCGESFGQQQRFMADARHGAPNSVVSSSNSGSIHTPDEPIARQMNCARRLKSFRSSFAG